MKKRENAKKGREYVSKAKGAVIPEDIDRSGLAGLPEALDEEIKEELGKAVDQVGALVETPGREYPKLQPVGENVPANPITIYQDENKVWHTKGSHFFGVVVPEILLQDLFPHQQHAVLTGGKLDDPFEPVPPKMLKMLDLYARGARWEVARSDAGLSDSCEQLIYHYLSMEVLRDYADGLHARWLDRQCEEIAANESRDLLTQPDGKKTPNTVAVARDKLKIYVKQWRAKAYAPKLYGDRVQQTITSSSSNLNLNVSVTPEDLISGAPIVSQGLFDKLASGN